MKKRAWIAALGAFLVVDAGLALLAVRHLGQVPDDPDLPAGAVAEETPRTDQVDFEFDATRSVVMSVANSGTVAYALRGGCGPKDDEARLWVSTNGGRSFKERDTDLRTIVAVDLTSDGLELVGGREGCDTAVQEVSTDDGLSFTDTDVDLWHLGLTELDEVVSPTRTGTPKCTVTSLVPVGETFARASCTDGGVMGTGDSGRRWVRLGRLDNVRVMTFSSFTRGYALARFEGCAARSFSTDDGGRSWRAGGCITGDPAQALAASDNELGALVGGDFYLSRDAGATYTQP